MNSFEVPSDVSVIVTHQNCPDGIGSLMVLRECYPKAELVAVQHGTPEKNNLKATSGMLFCDICPPDDRVDEFVDAGAYVLDHHSGTENLVSKFKGRGFFGSGKGDSGARLAFKQVACRLITKGDRLHLLDQFTELIGIRDTWYKSHPKWVDACKLSAGISFFPETYWMGKEILTEEDFVETVKIGSYVYEGRLEAIRRLVPKAREVTLEGLRVHMFQGTGLTSDYTEFAPHADIVIGFGYEWDPVQQAPLLKVSTRSRSDFDVSALCRNFGGNGHKAAAGFSFLASKEQSLDPYSTLSSLLSEYLKNM